MQGQQGWILGGPVVDHIRGKVELGGSLERQHFGVRHPGPAASAAEQEESES